MEQIPINPNQLVVEVGWIIDELSLKWKQRTESRDKVIKETDFKKITIQINLLPIDIKNFKTKNDYITTRLMKRTKSIIYRLLLTSSCWDAE